jgi:hypothetical protein
MSETPRWLEDARIPERMHAQGLPLDMMLSVDRGSDTVVLRVTTRHLTREEARELGSRLIEAALLAGEREVAEKPSIPTVSPCRTCGCMLPEGALCKCPHPGVTDVRMFPASGVDALIPEPPVRIVDQDGSHFTLTGGDYRLVIGDGISLSHYTMAVIRDCYGIRELHYADGRVERPS